MLSPVTFIMFHRSIDVHLLNAHEGRRVWKRVWYASMMLFFVHQYNTSTWNAEADEVHSYNRESMGKTLEYSSSGE